MSASSSRRRHFLLVSLRIATLRLVMVLQIATLTPFMIVFLAIGPWMLLLIELMAHGFLSDQCHEMRQQTLAFLLLPLLLLVLAMQGHPSNTILSTTRRRKNSTLRPSCERLPRCWTSARTATSGCCPWRTSWPSSRRSWPCLRRTLSPCLRLALPRRRPPVQRARPASLPWLSASHPRLPTSPGMSSTMRPHTDATGLTASSLCP
mmetsp:Transcript_139179/g.433068  ORF Transcript_139179/g.433068 Transcript_139179/m.433068 type:complete len:206 (+) Transcript_139179:387-1004(+)